MLAIQGAMSCCQYNADAILSILFPHLSELHSYRNASVSSGYGPVRHSGFPTNELRGKMLAGLYDVEYVAYLL